MATTITFDEAILDFDQAGRALTEEIYANIDRMFFDCSVSFNELMGEVLGEGFSDIATDAIQKPTHKRAICFDDDFIYTTKSLELQGFIGVDWGIDDEVAAETPASYRRAISL